MAICVGSEFQVDEDGRLHIRVCGEPDAAPWPYSCDAVDANPLRIDEACGIWAPPYAKAAMVSASGSTADVYATCPVSFTEIDTADILINNPSPCYSATVFRWVNVDIDFNIPTGDARVGAQIDSNSFLLVENGAPATGTSMDAVHWEYCQPLIGGGTIPPGGSLLYSASISVGNGQSGGQYGQVRWTVRALVLAGLS
ncbi:hypothetical protein [Nonomuraea sp. NEAU-A123]|uniref:hypothetical protein n=1 Tax=Nonomuraea sp. NEAU-A123 TaxID=2839649 RepID=UPI001BE3F432|nr:hypothetical protein [Nonomuraea sp. NEAU-A123]MBT2226237.1 hypothetical protein [Nonomuraea sp. NEAU-A123]